MGGGAGKLSPASAGSAGRLFVGVAIPPSLAVDLLPPALPAPVGRPLRPVDWRNLHLTLRFLGEVQREVADRLRAELTRCSLQRRFTLTLAGYGAFPRPERATTLWMAVTNGGARLAELAAGVEEAALRAGLPPARRPFRAHLTLARAREPQDVRRLIASLPARSHAVSVDGFQLFRSHLGGGPPRYEVLQRYPLSA